MDMESGCILDAPFLCRDAPFLYRVEKFGNWIKDISIKVEVPGVFRRENRMLPADELLYNEFVLKSQIWGNGFLK